MFFFGFNTFPGLRSIILFPLAILAAWWAWHDASKRNLSPLLWAAVSFSAFPMGLLVYLIYRAIARKNKI